MTIEPIEEPKKPEAFSPEEIYGRQFGKSLVGGYRIAEVDDYLDQLVLVFKGLNAEIERLNGEVGDLRARLEESRTTEESLRNALSSSQRLADEVIENARREADLIVREAELQRARAVQEASQLPAKVSLEVQALERQRDRLRGDLAAVIETHRRLLDMAYPEMLNRIPVTFFDVGPAEPSLVDGPLNEETPVPEEGINHLDASDAPIEASGIEDDPTIPRMWGDEGDPR